MKRILPVAVVAAMVSIISFAHAAEPLNSAIMQARDLSTSGGKSVTCNVAAQSGRRIMIWGLNGTSDKSGSVITVSQANATGVTGNYTAKNTFAVGAAAVTLGSGSIPLYVGDVSYALRCTLDSTTKNNLVMLYTIE